MAKWALENLSELVLILLPESGFNEFKPRFKSPKKLF